MQYRRLGRSGLEVSTVGLGTNNFGGRIDLDQTAKVLEQCLESGVTFIDTANSYGGGRSEEFIGKVLKDRRHQVLLATKVASAVGEGPNQRGASRKHILEQVELSLQRLQTDYIDLYQVHFPDPNTPIEETLRTLDNLVSQGKVRYIGSSNFAGWQLAEAAWAARTEHLTPFVSDQPEFSMLRRNAEREVLPFCEAYDVGVIPFFPLASGFLTGKYHRGEAPPEGTRLAGGPMQARWLNEANFDVLERLEGFARDNGHTIGELAIAWLLAHRVVASVIAGATKPEQVVANAKAAEWELTTDEKAAVDQLLKG